MAVIARAADRDANGATPDVGATTRGVTPEDAGLVTALWNRVRGESDATAGDQADADVQPYQTECRRVRTAYQTAHSNCSRRTGPRPPSALNVCGTAVSNRNPPSCDFFQKKPGSASQKIITPCGPLADPALGSLYAEAMTDHAQLPIAPAAALARGYCLAPSATVEPERRAVLESHRRPVVEVRQSARHLSARLSLTLGSPDLLTPFLCDFSWLEFRI
jgi:hypothetical protein